MELSIVVPVYNVRNYLRECIESILSQDYNNYEIILVDDGSTDGSERICDEYSGRYANIKTVHQKNGGVSKARNTGINNCRGRYILFLDSDDFLCENCLKKSMQIIKAESPDFLMTQIKVCGEENTSEIKNNIIVNSESVIETFNNVVDVYLWNASIYFADTIKSNNIYFEEGLTGVEDFDFFFKVLFAANKIYVTDICMFTYRVEREGSIMTEMKKGSFDNIGRTYLKYIKELLKRYRRKDIENILRVIGNAWYYAVLNIRSKKDCDDYYKIAEKYKRILKYVTGYKKKILVLMFRIIGIKNTMNICFRG